MTGVVGGWDTPPIPLLRPFDLAQGERNTPPPGMERPYFVSRFRGGNDGYARVSWRGMGRATSRACLISPLNTARMDIIDQCDGCRRHESKS